MRGLSDVVTKTDESFIPASISVLPWFSLLRPILPDRLEGGYQMETSSIGRLSLVLERALQ